MKHLRTKLIVTMICIAVVPVFPVYYVVKNLLERSLRVGYNQNVQTALDNAADISRQLFVEYKLSALQRAGMLAARQWCKDVFAGQFNARNDSLGPREKIDLFDVAGRHLYSDAAGDRVRYPELFDNILAPLAEKRAATILDGPSSVDVIVAFAPVWQDSIRLGSLILAKGMDSTFVAGSKSIVQVNQMFKTLDFFEETVTGGFLLSFTAVYLPLAALSIGLGIYYSRKMTSPLQALVEGTRRIAAGDWQYRAEVRSNDEIGQLVQAFNQMVSTMKQKQDQVIVLEKMAAWREMARVLAHEIKNPLTPIQLTVQQLKDKYAGDDRDYRKLLDECTEIITDEIEALRALVREFSEFARMPELNLSPGNLNELVEEVARLYPEDHFILELDQPLPSFMFDS
jgi:nitrogen fixation/metabolism regulation signal transduction histidine kinase